jgi:hypothetical protein
LTTGLRAGRFTAVSSRAGRRLHLGNGPAADKNVASITAPSA